jgi:hypothetical protein
MSRGWSAGERRPKDSTTWRLAKAITETLKGKKASMVKLDLGLMVPPESRFGCCIEPGPRLSWQRLARRP